MDVDAIRLGQMVRAALWWSTTNQSDRFVVSEGKRAFSKITGNAV